MCEKLLPALLAVLARCPNFLQRGAARKMNQRKAAHHRNAPY
jgi:hypothetical protein